MRRGIVAGVLAAGLTAASLLATGPAGAAAARHADTATDFGGYWTPAPDIGEIQVSFAVPKLTCKGKPGSYAGQFEGAEFTDGSAAYIAAGVRTYCHGTTPVYKAEFTMPTASGSVLIPASNKLRPGTKVFILLGTGSNGELATAGHTARASGVAMQLAAASAYVGTWPIEANANGTPQLSGPRQSSGPVLPGPVKTTPVKFSGSIGNEHLATAFDVSQVNWVSAATSKVVATASPPDITGSMFTITYTP